MAPNANGMPSARRPAPLADARLAPGRRCRTGARDTGVRVTPRSGRCGLSRNGCQTSRAGLPGQHAPQPDERDVAPGADQVGDEAHHAAGLDQAYAPRSGRAPRAWPAAGRASLRSWRGDLGQAPDARRRELDAVAGRIADIERAATARPGLLVLDRDAPRPRAAASRRPARPRARRSTHARVPWRHAAGRSGCRRRPPDRTAAAWPARRERSRTGRPGGCRACRPSVSP